MQPEIKVTGFELLSNSTIEVEVHNRVKNQYGILNVSRHEFQGFLLINEKLDWELNLSESGEHIQQTGTMSYEEYYDAGMFINEDLHEFCLKHRLYNVNNITYFTKL